MGEDNRVLITHDKALLKGGKLHPVDEELLSKISKVISPEDAAKELEKESDFSVGPIVQGELGVTDEVPQHLRERAIAQLGASLPDIDGISRFIAWGKMGGMEDADFVHELRVNEMYSWRNVAQACWDRFDGGWAPPYNQVMGMAMCERAAFLLGEDYLEDPWN